MKNTKKVTKNNDIKDIKSVEFVIEFLSSIEQPLSEKQIHEIKLGAYYLDQLLKLQKENYGV
jgi:hypothetical protein